LIEKLILAYFRTLFFLITILFSLQELFLTENESFIDATYPFSALN